MSRASDSAAVRTAGRLVGRAVRVVGSRWVQGPPEAFGSGKAPANLNVGRGLEEPLPRLLAWDDLPPARAGAGGAAFPARQGAERAAGAWGPDGRLSVEAVAVNGRAVSVDFRVRMDSVEVVRGNQVCAVIDRALLRQWLDTRPVDWDVICDQVLISARADGPEDYELRRALAHSAPAHYPGQPDQPNRSDLLGQADQGGQPGSAGERGVFVRLWVSEGFGQAAINGWALAPGELAALDERV